ncbi:ABC transporter permease [Humibacter sp. RRB41]|uniref:ABC transporter permease n=1 Tax=Humibacter sp. RRB41 TaxID=2919946 RepID=UPI001FAACAF7|nr:ABC transporter permease [Humibacter sp. RRB41]
MTDPKPGVAVAPRLTSEAAGTLAQQSGLREMGIRPPLGRYIRGVWDRRSFIWNLSSSRAYVRNQGSYLGQAWTVLRPILDAATMIIIFGFVFHGSAPGIENRAAFIVVGSFSYSFFQGIVMAGIGSIPADLQLIRSHQFPRAVVPLSAVLTETVLFGPIMVAMVVLVVLTGFLPDMGGPVFPHWSWLLLPVAAALLSLFSAGVALFFARLGARTPDIANVVPFFLSLGRFASGATFSIAGLTGHDSWFRPLLLYQPVQVFLELIRSCFGNEPLIPMAPGLWLLAIVYAVGVFVIGFLFFWGAEESYGRD